MTTATIDIDALHLELARTKEALTRAMFALAMHGNEKGVAMCLDAGIEVDVPNGDGDTALGLAISKWKYQVATLLIERGANVRQPFQREDGFLHRAIMGNPRYVEERCPELLVAYQRALNRSLTPA